MMNARLSLEAILENGLQEVIESLAEEDPVAAASSMTHIAEAIQLAGQTNTRLDRQKIAVLQNMHTRCTQAAENLSTRLRESVMQAGISRKAVETYSEQENNTE